MHALGIAGTQAAGLMAAQYGAMVKRMHAGRSSQSGLYGALFAKDGFTGIVDVFEAPYGGFCTTFSRSTDRFRMEELSAGLGRRFETMAIALKFYACVGSNHTTLDSIRDIQKRRPFTTDEFDKIVVHGSRVTVDHVGWPYKPEGLTSAQLNLPYCVATLLIEGDCFVEQFTRSHRRRSRTHGAVEEGRGGGRPRHHRARLALPAHGAGRRAPERRLGAFGDARGAARQRALVCDPRGDRRQVLQAHARQRCPRASRRL